MVNPIRPATELPKSKKTKNQEPVPELSHFSVVAALAVYRKDDATKQRHVNVLLECPTVNITRDYLNQVNQGVMTRLNTENGVTPDQLLDIVILSVSRLAITTRDEFYAEGQDVDAA
jgi:hypothetical protein